MIPEFYDDSEIFITGGSGVVGKALVEKLLRSCNVRKIYLLLRPKRNVSIQDRIQKIKKAMVFRRLHKEKPDEFDKKIVVIPGDAIQPMMGITAEYAKLVENVSIMFHSAATVRFDESLRDALTLNVAGTLETIKFAETLKHLKVYLYVSTFYSNPYLKYIEPKFYEAPMDWRFCLDLIKRTDIPDEMLETITKKLIVGFPNTYCFTKNLAESLVNDYRHKLPVAIYRPSIIVFAIDDPEPGYAPSLIGAMGLFALAGAGILKGLFIAKDQRLDLSPQDLVIKSMMYYGAKTAHIYAEGRPSEIPVFMVSSSSHNAFTFREYIRITESNRFWLNFAYEKNFLIPGIICTDNRLFYQMLFPYFLSNLLEILPKCVTVTFLREPFKKQILKYYELGLFYIKVYFKQILPSLLIDGVLKVSGRQPELMRLQRKVYTTLETMQPFLFNSYDSPGITYAKDMLTELDGTDFHMDTLRVSNNYYMNIGFCHDMVKSIREVLLKEDPATLPRSRRIMHLKIILYRMVQIFLAHKLYKKAMPIVTNWLDFSENTNDLMIENS